MTLPHSRDWPVAAELSNAAFFAAGRHEVLHQAVRVVLQAVMPTIDLDSLQARRSAMAIAWMHQCGMYLMAGPFAASIAETARAFSRDRATVLHAVRLVQDRCATSATTAAFVAFLQAQVIATLEQAREAADA